MAEVAVEQIGTRSRRTSSVWSECRRDRVIAVERSEGRLGGGV